MDRQPPRRSSLFLMELMIAILFFALASAVCVRFFVKSHTLNTESQNLSHATNIATSVAEIVRTQESPLNCLTEQFPYGEAFNSHYQFYYTSEWQLCSLEDASFIVSLETTDEGTLESNLISITEGEDTIYQLTVKKYVEGEALLNEN